MFWFCMVVLAVGISLGIALMESLSTNRRRDVDKLMRATRAYLFKSTVENWDCLLNAYGPLMITDGG